MTTKRAFPVAAAMHRIAFLATLAALASSTARAQASAFSPSIAATPAVRDALAWLDRNFPEQVNEWIRITEIPGTSRHEQARAEYVRAVMGREGLEVTTDSIGNVIGRRRGIGGGPTIVFAAHMDTVHPLDTDVKVGRSANADTMRAPGIFDNSASVANMLATIRAMNRASLRTRGDVIFIATVQEELGLYGMNYWLDHNPRPDLLVALDGGLGPVNYGALGIYWSRYSFHGEGSHTNTSAGKPHPARALADAIRSIYEIRVAPGRAVYNVGMLAGGKIFNAIPEDVSFTMDLRSVDPALIDSLDREIDARVERAARMHRVSWKREIINKAPAGGTTEMLKERRSHPLVVSAVDIYRWLGVPLDSVPARATGSTDSNAAVVRGIPSISIGRSYGGNQHTLLEWAHAPSALPATRAILLLAISMAGLVTTGA